MSTVFFAWELGGGLGHIMRIAPLARALCADGHCVVFATRDLRSAQRTFDGLPISIIPAPVRPPNAPVTFPYAMSLAHILHDVGFGNDADLRSQTSAWKDLYRLTHPEMIVFDHSPTALLAARGFHAKTVVMGSGFFIPPDKFPFPNFRPWVPFDNTKLRVVEQDILQRVNRLLQSWNQSPLDRLSQLYSQADERVLTTFRELDHYPDREATAVYWGPINGGDVDGKLPSWPAGGGKKIFAYLKNIPALGPVLHSLKQSGMPSIVYVNDLNKNLRDQFAGPTMQFENQPLDIRQVSRQCDLGITHGTLNTTTMLLMAGKPVLLIPLALEQGIIARLVEGHGAGLEVLMNQPDAISGKLQKLITDPTYTHAAARLAQQFGTVDLGQRQHELVERVRSMIQQRVHRDDAIDARE